MKLHAGVLIGALTLACVANRRVATGNNDKPPARTGAPTKARPAPTGVAMETVYQDLPDEDWKRAAELVVVAWRESLTKMAVARVVARAWRSPDGQTVPYMIRVEGTKADGSPSFNATGVVLGDKILNAGGAAAATSVLAAAGFPGKPISLGHLFDILFLTRSVEASWLSTPSIVGWNPGAGPSIASLVPEAKPAIDYGNQQATLHLYRAISTSPSGQPPGTPGGPPAPGGPPGMPRPPGGGSGFTLPEIERLDIVFDAKARFTQTVLRKNTSKVWQPVP